MTGNAWLTVEPIRDWCISLTGPTSTLQQPGYVTVLRGRLPEEHADAPARWAAITSKPLRFTSTADL